MVAVTTSSLKTARRTTAWWLVGFSILLILGCLLYLRDPAGRAYPPIYVGDLRLKSNSFGPVGGGDWKKIEDPQVERMAKVVDAPAVEKPPVVVEPVPDPPRADEASASPAIPTEPVWIRRSPIYAKRQVAVVDMKRLFEAHPLARSAAGLTSAEKSMRRTRVIDDVRKAIQLSLQKRDLSLVLDSSGETLNGVPVVLNAVGAVDLTPELLLEIEKIPQ